MDIVLGIAAFAFIVGLGIGGTFGFYIGADTYAPGNLPGNAKPVSIPTDNS